MSDKLEGLPSETQRVFSILEIGDSDTCWEWKGIKAPNGYGRINVKRDKWTSVAAHRWIYEHIHGPIDKSLDMDHLCRNRSCVNPNHLEPVTRSVNIKRGVISSRLKTQCKRGHEYSESNTRRQKGFGTRSCRECEKIRSKRKYAERKGLSI